MRSLLPALCALALLSACGDDEGSGGSGGGSSTTSSQGGGGAGGGQDTFEPSYAAVVLPEYWIPDDGIGGNDHYLFDVAAGESGQLVLLFKDPDEDSFHVRFVSATGDASVESETLAQEPLHSVGLGAASLAVHPSGDVTVCLFDSGSTGQSQQEGSVRVVRLSGSGAILHDNVVATVTDSAVLGMCQVVADGEDAVVLSSEGGTLPRVDRVSASGQASLLAQALGSCAYMSYDQVVRTIDASRRIWLVTPEAACQIDAVTGVLVQELPLDLIYPDSVLTADTAHDGKAYAVGSTTADDELGDGTFVFPLAGGQEPIKIIDGPSPIIDPFSSPPRQVSRLLLDESGWTMPAGQYSPTEDPGGALTVHHGATLGGPSEHVELPGPITLMKSAVGAGGELWTVSLLWRGSVNIGTSTLAHPGPADRSYFVAARFRGWRSAVAARDGLPSTN